MFSNCYKSASQFQVFSGSIDCHRKLWSVQSGPAGASLSSSIHAVTFANDGLLEGNIKLNDYSRAVFMESLLFAGRPKTHVERTVHSAANIKAIGSLKTVESHLGWDLFLKSRAQCLMFRFKDSDVMMGETLILSGESGAELHQPFNSSSGYNKVGS